MDLNTTLGFVFFQYLPTYFPLNHTVSIVSRMSCDMFYMKMASMLFGFGDILEISVTNCQPDHVGWDEFLLIWCVNTMNSFEIIRIYVPTTLIHGLICTYLPSWYFK